MPFYVSSAPTKKEICEMFDAVEQAISYLKSVYVAHRDTELKDEVIASLWDMLNILENYV